MKCLYVVKEDMQEVGEREVKCFDVVKEDMREVGEREDEVFARSAWRIHWCDSSWEKMKEDKSSSLSIAA